MAKKIFISGKITGDPNYIEKFAKMEAELKELDQDYIVLSPICLPEGMEWNDYMQITLAMVKAADAVLLLPDWQESKGAKLEESFARNQQKKIFYPVTEEDAAEEIADDAADNENAAPETPNRNDD